MHRLTLPALWASPVTRFAMAAPALLALLTLGGTAAQAQPIKVAILGADSTARLTDVQSKLVSTGFFSSVDIINANTTTPTLATLQTYRAVLVWSDNPFADATTLGTNLVSYVNGGGGVVQAMFAIGGGTAQLGGQWSTLDYNAIEPVGASTASGTDLTLGTVHEAGSPLLAGVTSFDGGVFSFRSTGALFSSAIDVADWSNGSLLVARRVIGGVNRVDLNFWPVSSDSFSGAWKSTTNGAQLMGNALTFTAGQGAAAPEPGTLALALTGALPLMGIAVRRHRAA